MDKKVKMKMKNEMLVSQSRSYVKDTNHFLSRLSRLGKIPGGALLCTVDVVGLYPSIPHGEDLEAIREALDRRENPGVATDTLVGLASLVLENNYFEFNDRLYRQKLGTAIGTNVGSGLCQSLHDPVGREVVGCFG